MLPVRFYLVATLLSDYGNFYSGFAKFLCMFIKMLSFIQSFCPTMIEMLWLSQTLQNLEIWSVMLTDFLVVVLLHCWDKYDLIIIYYFTCILLDLVYYILRFCIYLLEWEWSMLFFLILSWCSFHIKVILTLWIRGDFLPLL